MHTQSLPPSDRSEIADHDATLIAQVKATGATVGEVARGIGMSTATVSQWSDAKYPGKVAQLELRIRQWLLDRTIQLVSGVATIATEVSDLVGKRLEEVRRERELALVVGPAGLGKSRAISLYVRSHILAIVFRCRPWHAGMNGLLADLAPAVGIERWTKGQNKWETIIEKTKGSGRLLLVDDAQELSPRGLQCVVDYHEETGNPVALFGLDEKNASLKTKLLRDSRRARRVGAVVELACAKPEPLINHLLDQLLPGLNGERAQLFPLCQQVAAHSGRFGALEKQLKSTLRAFNKKPESGWVTAFQAAHGKLLRSYQLT